MLARQVGVAASTMRRYEEADDAEADGVLAVLRWLRVVPEDYVAGDAVNGDVLPDDGHGYIRVDMELVAAASGDGSGRATERRRTTIQRLVAVAQGSGNTIRSLTKYSEV